MTSVRFTLLNWLERIRNHVSEHLVHELRGSQSHPQSCGNDNNTLVVCVNNSTSHGKVDKPVELSGLGYEINKLNSSRLIDQLPALGANSYLTTAFYRDFLDHYASSKNYACDQSGAVGELSNNYLKSQRGAS